MIRISFRVASVVFILLVFGSNLLAQTSKGFLAGDVMDPNGAVIVGATVKITNTSTGVTRETVSSSDGSFRIDAIDPGTYRIQVSQNGFKTVLRDNVIVGASQTTTISFQLEVGTQAEVVNVVSGSDVILQTQDGARVNTLSQREITDLPIPALNPANVVFSKAVCCCASRTRFQRRSMTLPVKCLPRLVDPVLVLIRLIAQ